MPSGCSAQHGWLRNYSAPLDGEIIELTLKPATGGVFEITADSKRVWSRKQEGRFPEITELKQRVRDVIAPD